MARRLLSRGRMKGAETMTINRAFGAIILTVALTACGEGGRVSTTTRAVQTPEEAALLAFVNDQTNTTFEVLDVECGLRSDTVRQIIKHRDGKDKVPGTADDNLFDDRAELDNVAQVGPWSLEQLEACADSFGYTPTPYELAVINFLNDESTGFDRLDVDCGLRSNAAANLIAHRDANPFHSFAEVDSVPQVGPVTLELLGQCAANFGFGDTEPAPDPQQCTPLPWDGTFDQEEYFWDAAQASPELADIIPELEADAYAHRDTSVTFPIRFGEIYRHSMNGQVVHYQVRFNQMIDLEGGIQLWFYYDLDSCLNVIGFEMGI